MARIQYIETRFRERSLALLSHCEEVIDAYQEQGLTLTLRQLYYQLVVANIIENQEREYKNLGALVNRGRLAGLLDWDAIEDRTRVPETPRQWRGPRQIVQAATEQYRLDRWKDQAFHVELWVEKDALAGVLRPIADDWHITLMVNRGYSSQSAMHEAAARLRQAERGGRENRILYLGDLDPSGEDMVRDIDERLNQTFGARTRVIKLAITPEQVEEYQPPPNPAKLTDSRAAAFVAKHGYDSYEVDALPPTALRDIINAAVDEYLDQELRDQVVAQETEDKRELFKLAQRLRKEDA